MSDDDKEYWFTKNLRFVDINTLFEDHRLFRQREARDQEGVLWTICDMPERVEARLREVEAEIITRFGGTPPGR